MSNFGVIHSLDESMFGRYGTVRYGTVIAPCLFPCSFSFVPLLCCVVLCVLRVVGVDKPGISGGRPACVVPYVVVCAFLSSLWFCFVQVSLLTSLTLTHTHHTHTHS